MINLESKDFSRKTYVVSLGGSLLFKGKKFDVHYVLSFVDFIKRFIKKNPKVRFVLAVGGGALAREYINALRELNVNDEFYLDRVGLEVANLNALVVLESFKDLVYRKVVRNPFYKPKTNKKVVVYAGYKPGISSDYVASACAKAYGSKVLFNLTDVDYLYDKDPKKSKSAKKIERISWPEFIKMAGNFSSGKHFPFDPIASRFCLKNNISVVIMNGKDFKNIKNAFNGRRFRGTLIR